MLLSVLCFTSCKKEQNILDASIVDTKEILPVTDAEKVTVAKIKELSEIIKLVYTNKDALKEVNAAIYSGYHRDETVFLKDLLHPKQSILYKSDAFKKFNVKQGVFLKKFIEAKNTLDKVENSSSVLSNQNVTFDVNDYVDVEYDGFTIYFPYSANFLTSGVLSDSLMTIVAADRDSDIGIGAIPQGYGADGNIIYGINSNINDQYTIDNPTHIIGINYLQFYDPTNFDATPPPGTYNPTTPQGIYRVFHGSAKLKEQLDRLISFTGNGGGSEIKVCRISGYLEIVNQQVTNFKGDVISIDYERNRIRKKDWKTVYGIWHPDWTATEGEQTYAVYEEDTQGTKTFNGSLNTTVRVGSGTPASTVGGTIGFSVSVVTQDELITQRKISRLAYFGAAFSDQGCNFSGDRTFNPPNSWPIYDCGTIFEYTWPYNTY
jgi:hypothetical protein